MKTQSLLPAVTRELVPEDRRIAVAERLFGIHFPLRLEPVICKRLGNCRIDPTRLGLPFSNFAAARPIAPAPI